MPIKTTFRQQPDERLCGRLKEGKPTSQSSYNNLQPNRHVWFISDSDSDTDFYLALLARGNLSFIHYYLQQVSLTIYRVGCFDIPTPDAKTI